MNPELDALLTFALTLAARRLPGSRAWWRLVPDRWRFLVPLALAALIAALDAREQGATLREAAIVACWAFLAAMGGHKALRDAPGRYR